MNPVLLLSTYREYVRFSTLHCIVEGRVDYFMQHSSITNWSHTSLATYLPSDLRNPLCPKSCTRSPRMVSRIPEKAARTLREICINLRDARCEITRTCQMVQMRTQGITLVTNCCHAMQVLICPASH